MRCGHPATTAAEADAQRAETGVSTNYMLTKLLGEHVVADAAASPGGLPAVVVRPSFVGVAGLPPHRGYFFGAAGAMSLGALAVLDLNRTLPGIDVAAMADGPMPIVPVDIAAAAILAAAAATSARVAPNAADAPFPIFNVCTSNTAGALTYGVGLAALNTMENTMDRAVLRRLVGRDGKPPVELAPHLAMMTEAYRERSVENFKAMHCFNGDALADLVEQLAPGAADAAFPLSMGEGPETWQEAITAAFAFGDNLFKRR
jgi:nucleoside-diphosphate-sugar epimerase